MGHADWCIATGEKILKPQLLDMETASNGDAEVSVSSAAQAVVTVPASFTLAQREAMQVAATWAGIRVRSTSCLSRVDGSMRCCM